MNVIAYATACLVGLLVGIYAGVGYGRTSAVARAKRSDWPAPRPRLQPRPPPLDISQALHGDRIFCTAKACDPRCHIRNPRLHVGAGARHNHE